MTTTDRCDICGSPLREHPEYECWDAYGQPLPDGETIHGREVVVCCPACYVEPNRRR